MRKLAGELRFAQASVMNEFVREALKPLYQFVAGKGRKLSQRALRSLHWWETPLPHRATRTIRSVELNKPTRIYSDVAGEGGMTSLTFFDKVGTELPLAPTGQADFTIGYFADGTGKVYNFELSVFKPLLHFRWTLSTPKRQRR